MPSQVSVLIIAIVLIISVQPANSVTIDADGSNQLNWDVKVQQMTEQVDKVRMVLDLPKVSELTEENLNWLVSQAGSKQTQVEHVEFPGLVRWVIVPPTGNLTVAVKLSGEIKTDARLNRLQQETMSSAGNQRLDGNDAEKQVARIGKPRLYRGVRIAPLYLNPFSIDGASVVQTSQVELTIVADNQRGMNESFAGWGDASGSSSLKALSSVVLNPRRNEIRRDEYAEGVSRMMIVYNENIDNEETLALIRELADWKRRSGFVVDLVAYDYTYTEDWIGSNNDAVMDIHQMVAEKLDANPPLEYLTLIGGATVLDDEPDTRALELNFNTGMEAEDVDLDLVIPSFFYVIEDDAGDGIDTLFIDHKYTVFNDDDRELLMPEIKLGRFASPRYDMLNGALKRSIEYERNPYMGEDGDGEWYGRALLTIEPERKSGLNGRHRIDLQKWTKNKLMNEGYDQVVELWDVVDNVGDYEQALKNEISSVLSEGVSIALADGWLLGAVDDSSNHDPWGVEDPWYITETNRMNPFVLAQGKYYTNLSFTNVCYGFFNSGTTDDLNGPIATLGSYYGPDNSPNYQAYGAAVKGFVIDDLTEAGDLQIASKLHLLSRVDSWMEIPEQYQRRYKNSIWTMRLLGDPSVDIYTAKPEELLVSHPAEYQYGQNGLSFKVTDSDANPVRDALVCVRQVGEDDEWQLVSYTGADGRARFTVPGGLIDADVQVTVRKHNFRPYIDDVPVEMPNAMIALVDFGFDDSDSDDDGMLRNGESAILLLTLQNIGQGDAGDLELVISTNSEHLTLDEDTVAFDAMGAGEEAELDRNVYISLAPEAQGGSELRLQVEVLLDGEPVAELSAEFVSEGPRMGWEVSKNDDEFIPGAEVPLTISLSNSHSLATASGTVTLTSISDLIQVIGDPVDFNEGLGGEESWVADFDVSISRLTVNGYLAKFEVQVEDEDGYDTTFVVSTFVGSPVAHDPMGPDEYGYYCFDSGDTGWVEAPVYHWREINPDVVGYEFAGAFLEQHFEDTTDVEEGNGQNVELVALPFDITYYGQTFDTISVSMNGWVALGSEAKDYLTGMAQPLGNFAGPDAQIAICWQDFWDLQYYADFTEGIYTYHSEEEGIFVIEWSDIALVHSGIRRWFTFQIIFYDPDLYPTPTGDCMFKVQYKDYSRVAGDDTHEEFQYSFIGIRNLDNSDGLQYSYWDSLAAQAHVIEPPFALKYMPAVVNEYGSFRARVVVAGNEDVGVRGAKLYHPRLQTVYANDEGWFEIENILPGQYDDVVISAPGGVSETISFAIEVGETTEPDIPPMTVALIEVKNNSGFDLESLSLRPEDVDLNLKLQVKNNGTADLSYQVTPAPYEEEVTLEATYDFQAAAESENQINLISGSTIAQDDEDDSTFTVLYVAEQASGANQDRRYIFEYNLNGERIRDIQSPVNDDIWTSSRGFRGLAWDGTYLWGLSDSKSSGDNDQFGILVKFTLGSRYLTSLVVPLTNEQIRYGCDIQYVESRETFLISGSEAPIYEMDLAGNIVNEWEIDIPGQRFTGQGVTWNATDPDGMNIYFMQNQRDLDNNLRWAEIYRLDPETGYFEKFATTEQFEDKQGMSGFTYIPHEMIAEYTDRSKQVFGVLMKADEREDSHFHFLEGGPNYGIIKDEIQNSTGVIEPGDSVDVMWTFNVAGFPMAEHKLSMLVHHNGALEGDTSAIRIPIVLQVDTATTIGDDSNYSLPRGFGLTSIYPNPFNAVLRINYALESAGIAKLTIVDLTGRSVAVLDEEFHQAGVHSAVLQGVTMPSGLYFVKLEANGNTDIRKIALIK